MSPLELLGLSTLIFTLVKMAFASAQWITDEAGETFLRRHLDALYDTLDSLTYSQIVGRVLKRTRETLSHRTPTNWKQRLNFVLLFTALNLFTYLIAQGMYCAMRNECNNNLGHDAVLAEHGVIRLCIWLTLTFTGSLLLQLSSIWLTWSMLVAAAAKPTLLTALHHTLASLILLVAVFFLQYSIQMLATHFAFLTPLRWERMLSNIAALSPYILATAILALAASLPTFIYILTLAASILLRLMPTWLRKLFKWTVYRVTTDKTPVLDRLGYVTGGMASVAAAIAGYLRT